MASLVVKNDAPAIGSVFKPMTISYEWANPLCTVYNSSGALGIRVDVGFSTDVSVGTFVQILNGSYKGTYRAVSLTTDASYLYIVTDGTFTTLDSLSNRFNVDTRQTFELYGGYASGSGSTIKPYQKIADIKVAINPLTSLFDVDVQSYLRSYFSINPPQVGKDYGISLQWNITPIESAPTEQTIVWELAEQSIPFVDANLRIRRNGIEEVLQYSSLAGSFSAMSGDTIQVYAFGFSADYNQSLSNTINLLIEDSDTVTLLDESKAITNYAPTVVGEISFTFTVVTGKDYDITVTSTGS